MTDEQIIKALECCATDKTDDCFQCPYDKMVYNPGYDGCADRCRKDALDLINRQKAEIERLNMDNKEINILINMQEKNIREQQVIIDTLRILNKSATSEAIKEFAERLKSRVANLSVQTKTHGRKITPNYIDDIANQILHYVVIQEIDDLVKEMTEE